MLCLEGYVLATIQSTDHADRKRAYRFHFDHWGIEKYNCKKRNERKIRRKQPLPSPPLTSSPSQSSSITTSRGSRQGYANETFDFSQQSQDYFHDAFAIQSLPQNTGLAFPEFVSSLFLPLRLGL